MVATIVVIVTVIETVIVTVIEMIEMIETIEIVGKKEEELIGKVSEMAAGILTAAGVTMIAINISRAEDFGKQSFPLLHIYRNDKMPNGNRYPFGITLPIIPR